MLIFNYEDAYLRAGEDINFLWELLNLLENNAKAQLANIKNFLEQGELFEAYKEVHSLKGAVLNLGGEKVGAFAKEIEIKLKENNPAVDISKLEEYLNEFIKVAKEVVKSKIEV